MTRQRRYYPEKWRPTLSMIVVAMLVFVLALPLGGVWLFRFYDSQLVRETESELIAQGAFISAIVQHELDVRNFRAENLPRNVPPKTDEQSKFKLVPAQLDLATSPILPRRQDPIEASSPAHPTFAKLGLALTSIMTEAQRTTLAGFRVVDENGTVIAGRSDIGKSLKHILEVRRALNGTYASVIRERRSKSQKPPIYSISRGTNIRLFVAMPIEYKGKIAGAVYLSRTPSHFLRELYSQRWKLAGAVLFMLTITLAIALLFVRTIKGPIDALNERTKRIGAGDRSAISPISRHGTREIAELSHGLLSMSGKLQDRSDYIRTFANHVSHELKSPLTSIQGAAELLKDSADDMKPEQRNQFLDNIMTDTNRLTMLLGRLRDLAATENIETSETCELHDALKQSVAGYPSLNINLTSAPACKVSISLENLSIVMSNLLENSAKHGATQIEISGEVIDGELRLSVDDNGSGISSSDRAKIFDVFFTTRRDSGGTGMGLNIVKSLIETHEGSIELGESENGTCFVISLPTA